jgi:uncharacterized membrane protein YpjA
MILALERGEMRVLKKIGYGVILWIIPYLTAIPLLPLMRSDPLFFKTIMTVESSVVSAILTAIFFRSVERDFLREGIRTAITWIVLNWLLDYFGVVTFSGMSLMRYFIEIGLSYIAIAAPVVAVGYVLQGKMALSTPGASVAGRPMR